MSAACREIVLLICKNVIAKKMEVDGRLSGLQLQALSSLFATLMSAQAKIIGASVPVFEIVFSRSLIILVFSSWICWSQGINPFASSR